MPQAQEWSPGFRGICFILTWKYSIVNKSLHIDNILLCHCFNHDTFMFTRRFNITVPDSRVGNLAEIVRRNGSFFLSVFTSHGFGTNSSSILAGSFCLLKKHFQQTLCVAGILGNPCNVLLPLWVL